MTASNNYIIVYSYTNIMIVSEFYMANMEYSNLNNSCTVDPTLMAKDEDVKRASRSLKAISHPLRLKILCVLGDKEVSVQEIVNIVGTSQSNISQHLAILRDKDILSSRKDANRVYYRVGDVRILKLVSMMQDVFCAAN